MTAWPRSIRVPSRLRIAPRGPLVILAFCQLAEAACVAGQGPAPSGGDASTPAGDGPVSASRKGALDAGIGDGEGAGMTNDLDASGADQAAAQGTDDAHAADGTTLVGASGDGAAEAATPGGDDAAAGCPGLFCEDFEKGTLDPAVWNAQASGGQTVAVQSSVVAHGKYAIQFHAMSNIVSYDFIISKSAPAALRVHHFGRAYFNVTPKPPAAHTEFLFAGSAGFPKLKYLEVAGIGAGWQLTYVDLVGGGESYASGGNAPVARWICLEWEFNDVPDQATVFVDGMLSYARSTVLFKGQTSGLVGGFTDFGFGYYAWHPATYAFDVYYDDIVLDTKRVGCLP